MKKELDNTFDIGVSGDSEIIVRYLDNFKYDIKKKEEVKAKYDNLLKFQHPYIRVLKKNDK